MEQTGIIVMMYIAGLLLLVAEVFVPSHGLLTLAAMTCMGVAIYHTFGQSTPLGIGATVACLITVPAVLMVGIKYVRYLPMGEHFAPPNPTRDATTRSQGRAEYEALIGKTGRAVTPLHPVGVCEFNGRRVQCVAESGMIDVDTFVVGVNVRLNNLAVRPQQHTATNT